MAVQCLNVQLQHHHYFSDQLRLKSLEFYQSNICCQKRQQGMTYDVSVTVLSYNDFVLAQPIQEATIREYIKKYHIYI